METVTIEKKKKIYIYISTTAMAGGSLTWKMFLQRLKSLARVTRLFLAVTGFLCFRAVIYLRY